MSDKPRRTLGGCFICNNWAYHKKTYNEDKERIFFCDNHWADKKAIRKAISLAKRWDEEEKQYEENQN